MTTLDTPQQAAVPYGDSRGLRNQHCGIRDANGRGYANGHSVNTRYLDDWEPVYEVVHEAPERTMAARNGFRALGAALLAAGHLSIAAHALLNVLLEASNNKARAVDKLSIDDLATTLKCGRTKVLGARLELIEVGFLVMHNRKVLNSAGLVRQRPNRYGFTWTPNIIEVAGWNENTAIKQCGPAEIVYSHKIQRERRQAIRDETLAIERAKVHHAKIRDRVDEIILSTEDRAVALNQLRLRYPAEEDLAVALGHFEDVWDRLQASRYARQLVEQGFASTEIDRRLYMRYRHNDELLEHARAAALF